MFDPSVIRSGSPLSAVDPDQFRRAFQIVREKHERNRAITENTAVGLAAFAGSGVPLADHMEIFFRCTLLLMALDRGEFSEFRTGNEIDDRLTALFATFPFRAVNIQPDGSFQLNSDEFERALEQIRN